MAWALVNMVGFNIWEVYGILLKKLKSNWVYKMLYSEHVSSYILQDDIIKQYFTQSSPMSRSLFFFPQILILFLIEFI
jgi:hypothetical protein